MKIIKAKVQVTHEGGATQYVYPQMWLDNVTLIPQITYPNDRSDEIDENGIAYQIVYPLVPDDLYDQMLATHPEIFSVADQAEFEAYSDKHHPQKEIITDANAVITILAKAQLGKYLTVADRAVIDPNNDTAGVNMSERIVDIVTNTYDATF